MTSPIQQLPPQRLHMGSFTRMALRYILPTVAVLTLLPLTAVWAGADEVDSAGGVQSLCLSADTIHLRQEQTHRLLATTSREIGFDVDVTSAAVFTSDHPDVVAVNGATLIARSTGSAKVTASLGGKTAVITVTVSAAAADRGTSFTHDILPVLS